jgi:hypothetical protein
MWINNTVYKIKRVDGNGGRFVSLICQELGYIHGHMITGPDNYGSYRLTTQCEEAIHSSPPCFILTEDKSPQTQYITCTQNTDNVMKDSIKLNNIIKN